MSEYQRGIAIEAPAAEVFRFVSTVANFPRFLPNVQAADQVSPERARLQGVAGGRPFEVTGFLHVDRKNMRMEWGADGVAGYYGWLDVHRGDTSPNVSEVTVHLSMPDATDQKAEAVPAREDELMQDRLWDALSNIRREVLEERKATRPLTKTRGG